LSSEAGGSGMNIGQPMHQFEINRLHEIHLGGFDVSFTNSALFMSLAVLLISIFLIGGMSRRAMVPGRWQSLVELSYDFIAGVMRDTVGNEGKAFFPFVFTLFLFILFANFLGMMPFSFTVTSHIVVTFAMGLLVISIVVITGLVKHGAHFLSLFVPKGLPVVLLPLIVLIEVISFLTRPLSLGVRLFANMTAGHTMLKVFAGFVVALWGLNAAPGAHVGLGAQVIGVAPLLFAVAITGLELLVAFLQAYVFAVLTCIYLNDAIHLHDH